MSTIYSERMLSLWKAELGPHADRLGIPRAIFERHDIEYPLEKYYRLLESASADITNIGMRIGMAMRPGDLGALGHAMAASANLDRALSLLAKYLYVFAHNNKVRLDVGQERAIIFYQLNDGFVDLHRQDMDLSTCFLASTVRNLSGHGIDPVLVELEHSRPAYAGELEAHFRCKLRFGASYNRLHYRKQVLDFPCTSADPGLCEALTFYLDARLRLRDEEEPLAGRVYHLVAAALRDGATDIACVGSMLGMSRRTLQRRLAAEGLVFSDMVCDVRRGIADEYMLRSDYSLTDIALVLGYSDLSAFSRAYRRWTGYSPQEVRKRRAVPVR